MRDFFILTLILALAGCGTMSTDPRLVGTYVGTDSECLVFERDARVYFVRSVSGQEQRMFIGYAAAVSSSPPGSLAVSGPDVSPFVGTSFQVSEDFRTVTVRWRFYGYPKDKPRETEFRRSTAAINPMSRTGGSAGASLVMANVLGALPPVGYLERSTRH